ncbi:biosynthetic arginine decarboxylase [Aeromonas schubertii]|uniref:Biosynthetic arginine decarboxylase n=1 Tax=Aeromonas schubertii TaxID=652 RepID=A0A0S2SGY0_9GAMM|nr:biosynthetic arginine decarboxylase [Aeromonas schubertii]ALP40949.1 arginine decarboxylase [Aeromonas schubertii]
MTNWSSKDSLKVYNVPYWGAGFFGINEEGHVTVAPDKSRPDAKIVISEAIEQLRQAGLTTPVLLRFPDILKSRVDALFNAFGQAIEKSGYEGDYLCVYPIKVNQQRRVIETISSAYTDKPRLGLEAGSKPELLAVLSHHHEQGSIIVCNGYKDREYVRHALLGNLMGHRVVIVVEKPSELDLVLEESARLNIEPHIGVRAKLASTGSGMWESSGGAMSKFGLSATQILKLVDKLRQVGKLDCLELLHFHLGSQIANIRDIQGGVRECGRFYAELRRLGANVTIVDVGGGLGVDYEGTRSQSHCSANYSLSEYANNVVWGIGDVCREFDLPHPTIISESGRALTAHHAVLVTNVIGAEGGQVNDIRAPGDDEPTLLQNMWQSWMDLEGEDPSLLEIYHDSQADLSDVNAQYTMGLLNLEQRAWAESLHQNVCLAIKERLNPINRNHRDLADQLSERLADKCFVNFSLFQSLPDAWGIGQVFPVLPLTGLDRPLTRRGILMDITCDSDGQVEHYVDGLGVESTLPMPHYGENEDCHIGFFLVGAYQEILGDLHNLFGDTHCAEVWLDDEGQMDIRNIVRGDTVDQLLRYVNIDPSVIRENYQRIASHPSLGDDMRKALLDELELGLQGYAYLEEE